MPREFRFGFAELDCINNPNFAAKMLGYDRKTFGQMLHILKPANGLGPTDNVIFHDSGDVEFKGVIVDTTHDYAR
nr:hypothetical protein [Burkholderia anthina]